MNGAMIAATGGVGVIVVAMLSIDLWATSGLKKHGPPTKTAADTKA